MKTLKITIITAFILISNSLFLKADEKYFAAVKKGKEMIETGKTPEDYVAAANYFERIASVEKTQWIPLYYQAYSNFVAGILSKEANVKDKYFDTAITITNQAIILKPTESELFTLQGYIQFMKIYVDPMSRMQTGMKDAMTNLGKAKAMNPANPRPHFIDAQNTFYTPANFGGGAAIAKPKLEKADELFAAFKPADDLAPTWGADKCKELLKQCK